MTGQTIDTTAPAGFVQLDDGSTHPVVRSADTSSSGLERETIDSGGVIFTEHDMPALEDLLKSYRVRFAVFEKPAPALPQLTAATDAESSRRRPMWWRTVLAVTVAAAVMVTGALLLVAAALSSPLRPNPYVALFLFMGGLGLLATVAAALHESEIDA